ncbi:MAG: glycine cleavage system aminomethyltransferase GcvT, partial [Thermoflexibacteraceae bacterium]
MENPSGLSKQIPLHDIHVGLGGKIVDFAGYQMPVRYSSDLDEHHTVRNGVGVFDVSHMGEFILKGKNALELIQKVTTNDASVLTDGKAQYSCLPNEQGGIVDDLLVYRIAEDEYMLVVNASNIEKDWHHISKYNKYGVEMQNISDDTCLFAVQGPLAVGALQGLTDVNLETIPYYSFQIGRFAGVNNVVISATGYTGAGGFELYVPKQYAADVWKEIFRVGKAWNIKPIGLGARDTLRMEMGFCLYGNDIDDTTSPIEAGLGWITKFTKDFVASDIIKGHREHGTSRRLIAFEMTEKGIPRAGYEICNDKGEVVGHVTSGTQSPTLSKGIGLGYVKTPYSRPDTRLIIPIRKLECKAKVVRLPFYKKNSSVVD